MKASSVLPVGQRLPAAVEKKIRATGSYEPAPRVLAQEQDGGVIDASVRFSTGYDAGQQRYLQLFADMAGSMGDLNELGVLVPTSERFPLETHPLGEGLQQLALNTRTTLAQVPRFWTDGDMSPPVVLAVITNEAGEVLSKSGTARVSYGESEPPVPATEGPRAGLPVPESMVEKILEARETDGPSVFAHQQEDGTLQARVRFYSCFRGDTPRYLQLFADQRESRAVPEALTPASARFQMESSLRTNDLYDFTLRGDIPLSRVPQVCGNGDVRPEKVIAVVTDAAGNVVARSQRAQIDYDEEMRMPRDWFRRRGSEETAAPAPPAPDAGRAPGPGDSVYTGPSRSGYTAGEKSYDYSDLASHSSYVRRLLDPYLIDCPPSELRQRVMQVLRLSDYVLTEDGNQVFYRKPDEECGNTIDFRV
jgi:hypothetical protein